MALMRNLNRKLTESAHGIYQVNSSKELLWIGERHCYPESETKVFFP